MAASQSNPPRRLDVFVLSEGSADEHGEVKTYWNRCGVAFVNRDRSINVKLDLFPGVTLQIREPKPKEEGR